MNENVPRTNVARVNRKIHLVYLLAASHSGSTLLAMLLNSHNEICTVGELKATSLGDPLQYRCSCGSLIRECSFWLGISQDMAARGFVYDVTCAGTDIRTGMSPPVLKLLKPLYRGSFLETLRDGALTIFPCWRQGLPEILARNRALIESVAVRSGKRFIVDSSKIGIRLKYLLRIPELEISVIRLIRDGRGVALTYVDPARFADARDPSLRGGGSGRDRSGERLSLAAAAREWRRSNEEAEALLARLPTSQWLEVRYEELCRRPKEILREIAGFLKLDPNDFAVDFRSVEHHVVGNGMRLDSTSEISLDERWRGEFSARDLVLFEIVAGVTNKKLGYS